MVIVFDDHGGALVPCGAGWWHYRLVDTVELRDTVNRTWDSEILPSLSDLVRIPAVSVLFDPDWAASGHLDAAAEDVRAWLAARAQRDGRDPATAGADAGRAAGRAADRRDAGGRWDGAPVRPPGQAAPGGWLV